MQSRYWSHVREPLHAGSSGGGMSGREESVRACVTGVRPLSDTWKVADLARRTCETVLRPHFGEAALEEAALGIGADERERLFVGLRGFAAAIEPAEQVGARGVPQVVVGELRVERLDEREP